MYKLYHYPLCPFSRKIRFLIAYFSIPCVLIEERFWERRETFLKLSPACTVPLLIKKDGLIIPHSSLICDYFFEVYGKNRESLLPKDIKNRMKAKSLTLWFDEKFFEEVSKIFLYEKVIHTFKGDEMPDVNSINVARYNLQIHLEFLEFLLAENTFLAGDSLTIADIAASSHLSVIDYLSEIKWSSIPNSIKEWYSIVKSKLEFKDILSDIIPNIKPSITYASLDF